MKHDETISRPLAPEDVRRGMYVAVMHEITETTRCRCWMDFAPGDPPSPQVVRLQWMPEQDRPPMKVVEVCLPFVLVKSPLACPQAEAGLVPPVRTLDVRRFRLAQLSETFGRKAFKMMQGKDGSKSPAKNESC
jgi:hypothetical protein